MLVFAIFHGQHFQTDWDEVMYSQILTPDLLWKYTFKLKFACFAQDLHIEGNITDISCIEADLWKFLIRLSAIFRKPHCYNGLVEAMYPIFSP